MSPALPENCWHEQQSPSPSAWVAVRMRPASPFEQAAARMPSSVPAKHRQSAQPQQQQQQQHQHHQFQQQQQQQQQQFAKPRRSRLAALLSCICCDSDPAEDYPPDYGTPQSSSQHSHRADVSGTTAERAASSKTQLPVGRRLSGHKTWDGPPRHSSRELSRAETMYYDAVSTHDAEHDQLPPERSGSIEEVEVVASQLQQRLVNSACRAPWAPDTPLLFAPPGISFVPVPAHTAFAAYWENDLARTTPFPQPIDVMLGLNFLVKRMHKSIPGLWLQENDKVLTVTAKPGFLPPGALATYIEVFDKTNATEAVWGLRRDMGFGTMSGRIYMTSDGVLVLRTVARSLVGNKVESICEDYLTLEDNNSVVVDRMCCMHMASGKRAVQYQVGVRREHPPSGWGAPMAPGFTPPRTL